MSPFLRRLAGLLGRTAERPPSSSDSPPQSGNGNRGSRGGRGRGGGTSSPPPTDSRSNDRGDGRSPQGGGRQDNRYNSNESYDRRRPRRRDLDQPLPEDIAFRPPAEGGDRSILPSRRRPPPGLRATKRVLLTGHRFVPRGPDGQGGEPDTVDERDNLPEITTSLPGTANEPPTGEGSERTGRRRRGRRGGRGRRRGGDAGASDATPSDEA